MRARAPAFPATTFATNSEVEIDPLPSRATPLLTNRLVESTTSATPTSTFLGSQPRKAQVPPKGLRRKNRLIGFNQFIFAIPIMENPPIGNSLHSVGNGA